MLANAAIQNRVARAWDGTTAYARSIRDFVSFAFAFEVVATVTTDAVFSFQAAPPSAGNVCNPGTFVDVAAIPTCVGEIIANGVLATVTIPAGTAVGSICSAAIPCRTGTFMRLVGVSGTLTAIRANFLLHGPIQ